MRNVFITGANRGIGLELSRRYLERGDHVLAAVRKPTEAEELIAVGRRATAAHGGRLDLVELDLSNDEAIRSLATRVSPHVKQLDLLYNNAGILPDRSMLGQLDGDTLAQTFQVNSTAPILVLQALRPLLKTGDGAARVVNISSGYGSISENDGSFPYGYAASKAALNMLTKSAALSLKADGIVVVALCPGWVRTDMGGSAATLSVEKSVQGILSVVDALGLDDTGTFVGWDGSPRRW